MSEWLRQSTSITERIGPFLDDGDGFTAETALTITQPDVRLSKNGGAFAQKAAAQTLTHDENGYYDVTYDATDTDTLGRLRVNVSESGALPVWHNYMVVPANVYDALFGADKLQIDVAEWLGTAAATPSVAGVPEVDLTHVAGAVMNALVSGRMDSSTGAMAAAVVTAAAMASDAITAAKIAADAIGASELATDAVQEIVDALLDEVNTGATHNGNNTVGKQIRQGAGVLTGLAQAATASTITLPTTAPSVNDVLNGSVVVIGEGTGAGQHRVITAYVGATRVASISPDWDVTPDATSELTLRPGRGNIDVQTHTLPGQVAPPLTPTLPEAMMHLYKPWRNPSEQDGSEQRLFADNGTTVDQKRSINKTTGGTVELGKVESGP